MADKNVKVNTQNNTNEEVTEVKAKVIEAETPKDLPAETEKQSFSDKHPKLAAVGGKAKKVGKWVGLGAAVVGGLFVANKLGEARGFDKACDAFANNDDLNENDCGLDPQDEITEESTDSATEDFLT